MKWSTKYEKEAIYPKAKFRKLNKFYFTSVNINYLAKNIFLLNKIKLASKSVKIYPIIKFGGGG